LTCNSSRSRFGFQAVLSQFLEATGALLDIATLVFA
jgi:hypothetical protein